jgi:putative oxidoreductase
LTWLATSRLSFKQVKETDMYGYFTLIGRLLLAGLFAGSALGMITDPATTQYFMTLYGMPAASLFMWATVAILLASASCLVVGWKIRWAALTLALWLVPVTLIFHTNWADPIQFHAFMENVGLMGALIFISGVGVSAFSLDARNSAVAGSTRGRAVSIANTGVTQASEAR